MQKYIFVNGVMKLNPQYKDNNSHATTVSNPEKSLTVLSSTNDIMQATQASQGNMQLSDTTVSSMTIMQDKGFLDSYQTKEKLDGGKILDNLSNVFAKYEVPIGVVNKLLALLQYDLNFIIDDSGSMQQSTDSYAYQAGDYMRNKLQRKNSNMNRCMSRWEEAEDRLHIMVDMLAYIPTGKITIGFLNNNKKIELKRKGSKNIEHFSKKAHEKIDKAFKSLPAGLTPIMRRLKEAFNYSKGKTMHYLFTDGIPSDASTNDVAQLVKNRVNPENNPFTFISCTDQDHETEWMKKIEEIAPYTAELDDFSDERNEVLKDQGPAFPYTKGLWLISQLVSAINPDDLDAMDEDAPFTKYTLDNLLGRKLTMQEYQHYWNNHPKAGHMYQNYFNDFLNKQTAARSIIGNNSGYNNYGYNNSNTPLYKSGYGYQQPNNSDYSQNPTPPIAPNNPGNNNGYGNRY